jgi:hypothetical protein
VSKIPDPFTAVDAEKSTMTFAKSHDTLLTLSKAPRLSKESLKEMKSEFKASCRAHMLPKWQRVHDLLGPTSAWMTAMVRILIFHQHFASKLDQSLLHSILPILNHNVLLLQQDVGTVTDFLSNRDPASLLVPSRYEDSFGRMYGTHHRLRADLIKAKKLHANLRAMLHLNALLFAIQMFFQSWSELVEALPGDLMAFELGSVVSVEKSSKETAF